jgi:hypothetical protein
MPSAQRSACRLSGELLVPTVTRAAPGTLCLFLTPCSRGASQRPARARPARPARRPPGAPAGTAASPAWGEHEPAAVLAVAEYPQLDLLAGQAIFVHVPAAPAGHHRAVGLQLRRVPGQDAVPKAAITPATRFPISATARSPPPAARPRSCSASGAERLQDRGRGGRSGPQRDDRRPVLGLVTNHLITLSVVPQTAQA